MMMMMITTTMCAVSTFAAKKSCVLLLVELLPGLCWYHDFARARSNLDQVPLKFNEI